MFSLLKDWGIQEKVFSITLDNASSNDSMVDFLKTEIDLVCEGEYFHVRYCAHIMNLIVQDELKEVDDVIIKVRDSMKYYKGSRSRKQRFLSSVLHMELQSSSWAPKAPKKDLKMWWMQLLLHLLWYIHLLFFCSYIFFVY